MNIIYNASTNLMQGFLRLYGKCLSRRAHRKFSRFVKGQQGLIEKIRTDMASADRSRPTVWFHCASLGEYGVARPLIAAVKAKGPVNVVLTFFSPSGYEALAQRHPDIDYLYYLPLDTRRNANAFLDAVRPDRAVFMISEYWPNYLRALKFRAIPTFLVSAIIRDNSQFFKWYGKTYRNALSAFHHIFVLNEASRFNLNMLGYDEVTVSGDALFDNASLVAATPWHDEVIARFTEGRPTFIAGSISDLNDERLIQRLIEENPDTPFILVPHDVDPAHIERMRRIAGPAESVACYSELTLLPEAASRARVLIIDCIGKLAYLYRYGTWAYVGGGFTPLLHSVIEATVYGLPVSFGPRIERKVTPTQLVDLGIGAIFTTPEGLCRWFESLKSNPVALAEIKERAAGFVARNEGATQSIVNKITSGLWAND